METEQAHASCILITLPHTAYGAIVRGLDSVFALRPSQKDWKNRMEFLGAQE